MKHFFSKDKINAFLIHIGISLAIFLVLLYFILQHWYPYPLFGTDGGWQGIQLIAFVDIVLGPLLTLIVFKKGKPRLKLDLAIIAVIQFSALLSGTWVVYKEQPALVVFLENSFRTVTAAQLIEQDFPLSSVKQYKNSYIPMAFVKIPDDADALLKLRAESLRLGRPLSLYAELYEKLNDEHRQTIRSFSLDMADFVKNRPQSKAIYEGFLKQNAVDQEKLIYLPLYSRYEIVIAVLDRESFNFINVFYINPPDYGPEREQSIHFLKGIQGAHEFCLLYLLLACLLGYFLACLLFCRSHDAFSFSQYSIQTCLVSIQMQLFSPLAENTSLLHDATHNQNNQIGRAHV